MGMNVALIHFSLNFLGGAEKLCLETISAFEGAGHSVTLVTAEKTDWTAVQKHFSTFTMPNKEIYFTSAKLSKRLSNPIIAITLFFGYVFEHVFLKISGKYDIIVSTFGDLVYSLVDVAYVHFPLRASGTYSQLLPITNVAKWRFQSKLYNLSLLIFNKIPSKAVLVNSSFIQRVVENSLHVNAKVITPPVDVNYFLQSDKNQQRKDTIITLSGYSPKRHLEQIPAIASRTKFGKFMIIGKTDEYSFETIRKLETLTRQLNIENRIELLKNVSRLKLRELLAEAKIYLHAMPNEHFGTAIVEAMASGCVPIVHKSGGPWLDILDQKQGEYGYAYCSPEEAAKYIDILLVEDDLRKEIALRAMERSLKYDASIFAKKMVAIAENLGYFKRKVEKEK